MTKKKTAMRYGEKDREKYFQEHKKKKERVRKVFKAIKDRKNVMQFI